MTIKENFQNLCATANEAGRKQLEVSDDAPKHEHTQTYSSVEKTMVFYFEKKKKKERKQDQFLGKCEQQWQFGTMKVNRNNQNLMNNERNRKDKMSRKNSRKKMHISRTMHRVIKSGKTCERSKGFAFRATS